MNKDLMNQYNELIEQLYNRIIEIEYLLNENSDEKIKTEYFCLIHVTKIIGEINRRELNDTNLELLINVIKSVLNDNTKYKYGVSR